MSIFEKTARSRPDSPNDEAANMRNRAVIYKNVVCKKNKAEPWFKLSPQSHLQLFAGNRRETRRKRFSGENRSWEALIFSFILRFSVPRAFLQVGAQHTSLEFRT